MGYRPQGSEITGAHNNIQAYVLIDSKSRISGTQKSWQNQGFCTNIYLDKWFNHVRFLFLSFQANVKMCFLIKSLIKRDLCPS